MVNAASPRRLMRAICFERKGERWGLRRRAYSLLEKIRGAGLNRVSKLERKELSKDYVHRSLSAPPKSKIEVKH